MLVLLPLLSFALTLILLRWWCDLAKARGLVGKDMHKKDVEAVEEGGICVIFSVTTSFLLATFFLPNLKEFFLSVTILALFFGIMGLLDRMLGWKRGLRQRIKPVLSIIPALVLLSVFPDYEFLLSPPFSYVILIAAVVGAANGFNMLAGYNGLEAGMGVIILSFQALLLFLHGNIFFVFPCLVIPALLAFLVYNWYPAKTFPGDSLTHFIGGLIGFLAVVGKIEILSLILFVPYFIELFLKAHWRFQRESFAKLGEDGRLYAPEYVSTVPHLVLRFKPMREDRVVLCVLVIECLLGLIALTLNILFPIL